MKTRKKADCVFHNLREASRAAVMKQHAEYWASAGGLPREARSEHRIICRDLTYDQAVDYLGMVNAKLMKSHEMASALIVPFVIGWLRDGGSGEALGFPVEVWMTQAHDDRSHHRGLWDIVCNSSPLYRLPWIWGLGWVYDKMDSR